MILLTLLLQAQAAADKGQWVLDTWQLVVGGLLAIISTIAFLKSNIPQRLASGWKDVSEMEKRQAEALKVELEKLKTTNSVLQTQIVDLTREVDVRREINRQDTTTIANLKIDLQRTEESLKSAREQLRAVDTGGK